MAVWALCCFLAAPQAVRFEDPYHRFTIDLPAGWTFAPVAGQTDITVFRREDRGLLAQAGIQVLQLGANAKLEDIVKFLASGTARLNHYKVLRDERSTVVGQPGWRRRATYSLSSDPELLKMVEDRVFVRDGLGYVLHVESLAESFPSFDSDFSKIFSGFRPLSPTNVAAGGLDLIAGPAIGRWIMVSDPDIVLELRSDGSFILASASGTFSTNGDKLVMSPNGGGEETFVFRVHGDELLLHNANLPEPVRYRRAPNKGKKR